MTVGIICTGAGFLIGWGLCALFSCRRVQMAQVMATEMVVALHEVRQRLDDHDELAGLRDALGALLRRWSC